MMSQRKSLAEARPKSGSELQPEAAVKPARRRAEAAMMVEKRMMFMASGFNLRNSLSNTGGFYTSLER
ncbi:hypothetical protein LshimejAT787_1104440 [Lyophyllum shimeji]|uniref:Uncharacterized protein n=1 Tax=Lyophyllum shimeji TaxID=47721 RepID=A0A9P3UP73_LYOSH|nr:hypothetical protein LshimejAT787_1104440 [Lyophyllum shimeji]